MNSKISLIIGVTLSFMLMACDETTVNTPDGAVPAAYLSQALKLEGSYQGSFNKIQGTLTVHFIGNKPEVSFAGINGDDILGGSCASKIGQLVSVTVPESSSQTPAYVTASFAFDPGQCGKDVQGHSLDLTFKQKSSGTFVRAQIYQYTQNVPGNQHCTPTPNGGQYCNQEPPQPMDFYLDGSFQKN